MRRLRPTPARIALLLAATVVAGLGTAFATTLSASSSKLWGGQQTLTKSTCTLNTAADTWVDQASPTTTHASGDLSVSDRGGSVREALVTFDLSSCGLPTTAGADSATLTLDLTSSTRSNHTISVYPVYSSWSPSTLTWNGLSGLTVDPTPTTTFASSAGTKTVTVTAQVDAAIKSGALWGWVLVDTAGPGTATSTFASAENSTSSRRPSLTVSYER
ncbi:MAG TPA: DNRLRE domain-containing protein [Gaiellaceae bacterium]|nr:DNRLRE domain-containing protein [Gaiellaceae bacterium]